MVKVDSIIFDKLPIHDTCWSQAVGADGRIYAAACCEHTGGVAAWLVRYDAESGEVDYLFDVGDVVGEPSDNGRATQCKIHYSFLPTADGLLWGATHLSGPPIGHIMYPHWGGHRDRIHGFRGAMFFLMELDSGKIIDRGLLYPHEGSRALALNERDGLIYVVGYPLDHFAVYDYKNRTFTDCGRLGSVNPQGIWVDPDGNGYTTDDFGRIIKYDAARRKLVELNVRVPHPKFQDGWHTVVYDMVAGPDPSVVFGVTWASFPHIFRYDMGDGPEGRMDDLGPAQPEHTGEEPSSFRDHVGGMVLADDDKIYCGVNHAPEKGALAPVKGDFATAMNVAETHMTRIDPASGKIENLGVVQDGDYVVRYFARGNCAGNGDLVFCGPTRPVRLFRYRPEVRISDPKRNVERLRKWG
ncbi:MAG TPA: hypothetical protein VM223_20220 [Planctomycetota bacterium]|nr:hypothetical protein [Planctomycetota bacterium]